MYSYIFSDNNKIKTVIIETGATSIGNGAFFRCYKLASITIPNTVKSIGYEAFVDTVLSEVFIPSSVKEIGKFAFGYGTQGYFGQEDYFIKEWFEISGYKNSEAERYAEENNIKFVAVDEAVKPSEPVTEPTTVPTTQAPVTTEPTTVAPATTVPTTVHTTTAPTTAAPTTQAPATKPSEVLTTQAPVIESATKPSEEVTTAPSTEESTTVHTHTEVVVPAEKATYTSDGKTEGKKCSECGKILVAQKKVARKKLSKVKNVKVSSVKTDVIKITWKKVEGAEKYKVSYSTDGKKWKTEISTDNIQTVKKLKSGTSYRFKVKAVADKYEGTASSVLKASTKVSKPTVKSVKSSKAKQVVVTWKKVNGADGYVIEYSTSKKFTKKTTKTVKIKKGKTTKTTLKKLKSGKKYYVRVKAYKTVSKKAVYGAYSKVKTVKVK